MPHIFVRMILQLLVAATLYLGGPDVQTWRLRYVDLRIDLSQVPRQIVGVSRLTLSVTQSASSDLVLDVSDSLTVDSARITGPRGLARNGTREPGHVRFAISGIARQSDTYRVAVWYHGQPIRRAIGFTDHNGILRAASFGIPLSAREWWPTIDDPSPKADSADIRITTAASSTVASNGKLVDRVVSADGATATSHWKVRHPIYPDVISFAAGDYAVTRTSVRLSSGRNMPIELYAFPEDSVKAATDFANVPKILSFLEKRLGKYPFGDEKYALAEFARQSFREGQTITNIGAPLITGSHDAEKIIAHEVAHQWFGNSLTVKSWDDIWLNESLAEFMAWQWIRESAGDSAYRSLFDEARKADLAVPMAPAKATDFSMLFGTGTFVKGPVVIAMLRDLLGEKVFDKALREYVAKYSYRNVSGADFQKVFETAFGKPLDSFFQKFVYGKGVPDYKPTW